MFYVMAFKRFPEIVKFSDSGMRHTGVFFLIMILIINTSAECYTERICKKSRRNFLKKEVFYNLIKHYKEIEHFKIVNFYDTARPFQDADRLEQIALETGATLKSKSM